MKRYSSPSNFLNILWIRGNTFIDFNRPNMFYVIGIRGSGKSNFLEAIGEEYLANECNIIDLCDAKDGEGLGWAKKYPKDVLILHDAFTQVEMRYDHKTIDEFKIDDIYSYRIIINSTLMYADFESYLDSINIILQTIHGSRRYWRKPIYAIIREAQNIVYARLRKTGDQTQAKAQTAYLLRESRHVGMATGIDTIRLTSVDIEIRALADLLIIKNMGLFSLPKDIFFLYSYLDPFFFRFMQPQDFVVLSKEGCIGLGEVKLVDFHKEEKENILGKLDIKISKTIDPLRKIDGKLRRKILTHKKIMDYLKDNPFTTKKALSLILNISTPTVITHINKHNMDIKLKGYCELCSRINHLLINKIIK